MELKLEEVTMQFKGKTAVDKLSLNLTPGIYGLLGANGAGKTTTMEMISTILNPSSGKITFDTEEIHKMGERYLDILGYQVQQFGYYPNFTAEEFIDYIGALKGLTDKKTKERMDELFTVAELNDVRKKKIKTFSGGMKQRLNFIQAMLNDPKVILLDEPTAGLDPKQRLHYKNYLSSISKDKIVILSTHITADIENVANYVILLKSGKLLKIEEEEKLLQSLKEKIWEILIPEKDYENIASKYNIIGFFRSGSELKVRIVSDKMPDSSAIPQIPTLEDVYLYYNPEEMGTIDE